MSEQFENNPEAVINLKQYREIVSRRRWPIMLSLFLGWLFVWGVSWLMPSVYRSGTLILVEQPSVPQQYVLPNVTGDLQNRLDSITQQILSRTRLSRLIEKLNLYPAGSPLSSEDRVERIRKDIEIELERSRVRRDELTAFNIYFSSRDPHVAQEVTSELTNLFINENLEVRQQQSERTTEFLESELEASRKSLGQQEQRVREYKDRYLGELPGQLQSNLEILRGFQSQLQTEQDGLNSANQQRVYLQSLLGQYRSLERSAGTGEGVSVGLPAIDRELERLNAQLADLSSHYTEQHPDVRKLREQIAKTERMKRQITAELQSDVGNPKEPNSSSAAPQNDADLKGKPPMMELESQLKANQIEIANRQHAIKVLEPQIREYQARLNRTPVREQQLADISRDYDQSRTNFESLLAKKNQSELATNLERRQQGEHFRILDPPSLPTKPYSPNRLLLSCVGLIAGLVLGGGITAGLELTDDRIYNEIDMKKLLPADVLAEIPPLILPDEQEYQQRKFWMEWLSAGLIFTSILAGFVLTYLRG